MNATSEPGLLELRMTARPHVGHRAPDLPGKFIKFLLEKPPFAPFDVLVSGPDAVPASNREPFVLMLMPKRGGRTRVAILEPTTAVDTVDTPTDAPSTGPLGAADGGTGEGEGGAQDIALALMALALKDSCAQDICAHCGKQGGGFRRCSTCKQTWYCGAACQKAAWKGHKKSCEPWVAPAPLENVGIGIAAAEAVGDWRGVLKWEGRMGDLMAGMPDKSCEMILGVFSQAHKFGMTSTGNKQHAIKVVALETRRVELLGRIERFRDQAEAMFQIAHYLDRLGRRQEAAVYYQRMRDVGEAHGFFSAECRACQGLGEIASKEGRDQEGLDLLRNALVYPTPYTLPPPYTLHPQPSTLNPNS